MQCAGQKDWETHESPFREPVKRRAEYDETIIRQPLDTVKVLDKQRLLAIFKGGAEVEQAIEP